jgi:arylsulfatase A
MTPRTLAAFCTLLACAACADALTESARPTPNIVLFFIDDMGYADPACYNPDPSSMGYETPNIDRLAREGARFTDFYAAQPVCSASRAAILTGCYPNRIGILGALGPNAKHGLNPDETTLAELCKSKGYATAIFGKWHLGHRDPFQPTNHGFDEWLGIPYSNDMWPLHPAYAHLPTDAQRRKQGYPELPVYAGTAEEGTRIIDPEVTGEDQAQFTTRFGALAADFIARHKGEPFFVYIPHPMPHVPLFAGEKFKGTTERGLFGDVIEEIDWTVGLILDTLETHDLDDNTLVIFTTDNGPWVSYGTHAGSAEPLREAKGTTWDGGVRVPCLMRWPGTIEPGTTITEPAMTIDLLPTLAGLIGADLPDPDTHPIDGKDIWPVVTAHAPSPHDALFFYWNRHLQAVRSGDWSLHFPHAYRTLNGRTGGTDGTPVPYEQATTELALFNLRDDISQSKNLASEHPEIVARLAALADKARAELGDSATKAEGERLREPGRVD